MKEIGIFIRPGKFDEIDQIAIIEIDTFKLEHDPMAMLKKAVTRWVNETKEGKELWDESFQDLNIGDLITHGFDNLENIMAEEGINAVNVLCTGSDSHHRNYDEVLVNEKSLCRGESDE
jgi:hypothetical protein